MLARFINEPEFLSLIDELDPEEWEADDLAGPWLPAGAVLAMRFINADGTDFLVTIHTPDMSYFERLGLLTSAQHDCMIVGD
jgi:hypothetical protein